MAFLFQSGPSSIQSERKNIFGSDSFDSEETPHGFEVLEGIDEDSKELELCNFDQSNLTEKYMKKNFDPRMSRFVVSFLLDRFLYGIGEPVFARVIILSAQDHFPVHTIYPSSHEIYQHFGGFFFKVTDTKNEVVVGPIGLPIPENSVISFQWNIPIDFKPGKYSITIFTRDGIVGAAPSTHVIEVSVGKNLEEKEASRSISLKFGKLEYSGEDVVNCILTNSQSLKKTNLEVDVIVDDQIITRLDIPSVDTFYFSFKLPSKFVSGIAVIHIYSKEEEEEEEEQRRVLIFAKEVPLYVEPFSLQIIPESGHIIRDISNGIYLQAYGRSLSDPIKFVAEVREEIISLHDDQEESAKKGKIIKVIRSMHEGRTVFNFTPSRTKKYRIIIRKPKNILQKSYELGPIEKEGVGLLLVKKATHRISDQITLHIDTPNLQPKEIRIGLFKDENTISFQRFRIRSGINNIIHLLSDGNDGVLRISVFDVPEDDASSKMSILAERLVFIKALDEINFDISTKNVNVVSGEKVKISVAPLYKIQKVRSVKNVGISTIIMDEEYYSSVNRRLRPSSLLSSYYLENQILSTIPVFKKHEEKKNICVNERSLFDNESYFFDDLNRNMGDELDEEENILFDDEDDIISHEKRMDLILGCQFTRKGIFSNIHKTVLESSQNLHFSTDKMKRLFCIGEADEFNEQSQKKLMKFSSLNVYHHSSEKKKMKGFTPILFFSPCTYLKPTKKLPVAQYEFLAPKVTESRRYRVLVDSFTDYGYVGSSSKFVLVVHPPILVKSRYIPKVIVPPCSFTTPIEVTNRSSKNVSVFLSVHANDNRLVYSEKKKKKKSKKRKGSMNKQEKDELKNEEKESEITRFSIVSSESKTTNTLKKSLKKSLKSDFFFKFEFFRTAPIPSPWKFMIRANTSKGKKEGEGRPIPVDLTVHPNGSLASQSFVSSLSSLFKGKKKCEIMIPISTSSLIVPNSSTLNFKAIRGFPSYIYQMFRDFQSELGNCEVTSVFSYTYSIFPSLIFSEYSNSLFFHDESKKNQKNIETTKQTLDFPMKWFNESEDFLRKQIEETDGLESFENKGIDELSIFPFDPIFLCELIETSQLLFVLRRVSNHTKFRKIVKKMKNCVSVKCSQMKIQKPMEEGVGSTKQEIINNFVVISRKLFLIYVMCLFEDNDRLLDRDGSFEIQFNEIKNYLESIDLLTKKKEEEESEEEEEFEKLIRIYNVVHQSLICLILCYGRDWKETGELMMISYKLSQNEDIMKKKGSSFSDFSDEIWNKYESIFHFGRQSIKEKKLEVHLFSVLCFLTSPSTFESGKKLFQNILSSRLFGISSKQTNPFLLILQMETMKSLIDSLQYSIKEEKEKEQQKDRDIIMDINDGEIHENFRMLKDSSDFIDHKIPFFKVSSNNEKICVTLESKIFCKEEKEEEEIEGESDDDDDDQQKEERNEEEIMLDDRFFPFLISLDLKYRISDSKLQKRMNSKYFSLLTEIEEKNLVIGNRTEFTVQIISRSEKNLKMGVVNIYIPPCFGIDLESLVELKKSAIIDCYGLINEENRVVFVFSNIKPKEYRRFEFGVKALCCGDFKKGRASFMYFFNSPSEMFWIDGINDITVSPL